eukprot:gb/GECG01006268.1/.p1 GENE.gb/GECG01006268.1/~~gb/GECG01006268.1/.p1  ORF type:complete len:348 (+),score=15.59 gb/GECG01006268.1/:1-1044(+)
MLSRHSCTQQRATYVHEAKSLASRALCLTAVLLMNILEVNGIEVKFRYIKWTITERKAQCCQQACVSKSCIQVSIFRLRHEDAVVLLKHVENPNGASPAGEGVGNIIAGTGTKWLDYNFGGHGSQVGQSVLISDSGAGSAYTFDSYEWYTANDNEGRDPKTWTLHGSDDRNHWFLLHEVTGYSGTSVRGTLVKRFYITSGRPTTTATASTTPHGTGSHTGTTSPSRTHSSSATWSNTRTSTLTPTTATATTTPGSTGSHTATTSPSRAHTSSAIWSNTRTSTLMPTPTSSYTKTVTGTVTRTATSSLTTTSSKTSISTSTGTHSTSNRSVVRYRRIVSPQRGKRVTF